MPTAFLAQLLRYGERFQPNFVIFDKLGMPVGTDFGYSGGLACQVFR